MSRTFESLSAAYSSRKWKRKSFVTAGKTWLVIFFPLFFHVRAPARSPATGYKQRLTRKQEINADSKNNNKK